MNHRAPGGALLVLAFLAGSTTAADPLKSGPKVGDEIPGSFYPLNITGADAGKKRCLV